MIQVSEDVLSQCHTIQQQQQDQEQPCRSKKVVSFADPLVQSQSDTPPRHEPGDWSKMNRTKKERQVVREMARHHARIVMEMDDTNNIHNNGNDSSKLERVPITYRAYLSCRPQEEDMTEEEALHLSQWMIRRPVRRGLERMSVRGLDEAFQSDRTDAMQSVMSLQCKSQHTDECTLSDDHNETTATTMALRYGQLCETSSKFAFLLGCIDAEAVKLEQEAEAAASEGTATQHIGNDEIR